MSDLPRNYLVSTEYFATISVEKPVDTVYNLPQKVGNCPFLYIYTCLNLSIFRTITAFMRLQVKV